MISQIPNLVTLLNAFLGMVGITYALNGEFQMSFYMMICAGVADFLDGFVARLLKVSSAMGAELDSLSDVITFGALPGLIIYKHLQSITTLEYLPFIGFIITICAAYRLAKFNISEEQSINFRGLPTPITALFIASLVLIEHDLMQNVYVIIGIELLCGFLMISDLPILGLKFKGFGIKENLAKYLLILISIILIFALKIAAIPFILLSYILISLLHLKLKII